MLRKGLKWIPMPASLRCRLLRKQMSRPTNCCSLQMMCLRWDTRPITSPPARQRFRQKPWRAPRMRSIVSSWFLAGSSQSLTRSGTGKCWTPESFFAARCSPCCRLQRITAGPAPMPVNSEECRCRSWMPVMTAWQHTSRSGKCWRTGRSRNCCSPPPHWYLQPGRPAASRNWD